MSKPNYVRLRGIPFSSKDQDIKSFIEDSGAVVTSVTLPLNHEGRASGDAYVGLKTSEDVEKALTKHKELIDKRYIEVFHLSLEEYSNAVRRGQISEEGRLVRLRGMPFNAVEKDVKEFLKGCDCEDIVLTKASNGRPSGDAFVRLASKDQLEEALKHNKEHMGQRYVEVFEATHEEILRARGGPPTPGRGGPMPLPLRDLAVPYPPMPFGGRDDGRGRRDMPPMRRGPPQGDYDDYPVSRGGPMRAVPPLGYSRSSPYDMPPRPLGGHNGDDWASPTKILMRGLPYDVNISHIEKFFSPLRCYEVKLGFNEERRPSGDGTVEFGTISEAREALLRDKQCIGSRYIELFPSNDAPPNIRRVRFRTIGGTPAPPPAPLSGRGGGGHYPSSERIPYGEYGRGYDQPQSGNGYGRAPIPPPSEPPTYGRPEPVPHPSTVGRGGGAYSSFPSREYSSGAPPSQSQYDQYGREPQGYGNAPQSAQRSTSYDSSYDVKPTKKEIYDQSYESYSQRGSSQYDGYRGGAAPQGPPDAGAYGSFPSRRPGQPQQHGGAGDYGGYGGGPAYRQPSSEDQRNWMY